MKSMYLKFITTTVAGIMLIGLPEGFAGTDVGNGGGAWVCKNNNPIETNRWIKFVDLYEAQTEFGLTIPNVADHDYLGIVDTVMISRLLPLSEALYKSINDEYEFVKSNLLFIDADLQEVDDALYRIRPAKTDCLNGTLSYAQLANYTTYGKILIQKSLFQNANFTAVDKAALMVHEAIYAFLRARYGDKDSVRTRKIVGLLFSVLPNNDLKTEIEKLLGTGLNSIGMEFVNIQAGTFWMGSPDSERGGSDERFHQVKILDDFEMQTTELTQKQYFDVMGIAPFGGRSFCSGSEIETKDRDGRTVFLCANHPVVFVSWDQVQEFIQRLNTQRRNDGYFYRLPTEAEWEFAARAGTQSAYSFGADPAELPLHGWFSKNSDSEIHAVARLKPNAFGLYDMHGNVWEWTADVYRERGQAPGMVIRGGSWANDVFDQRSAVRDHQRPYSVSDKIGFRLVRILAK